MKYKTTKKAVMAGYITVICVPYAELQHLLRFENPVAYTCGTYGWNADIYYIGNSTAICTGYRSFGNVVVKHDVCRKYDQEAKHLIEQAYQQPINGRFPTWEECNEMLQPLIADFVEEVCC